MHETHRLSWDGAVDADGHILEPADVWEKYIDPKYRDRSLRVVPDENGLDELEIGGKRSQMSRRGFPSTLAAMGRPDLAAMAKDPDITFENHAPAGSRDVKERLKLLDAEHIDAAVIYTTVGLLWGGELLVADLVTFERVGHLRPITMPGGTRAIREPWRMAVAWCLAAGVEPAFDDDRLSAVAALATS